MANCFRYLLLSVGLIAFSHLTHGQDTYKGNDWSNYIMDLSGKKSTPKNLNNSKRDGFYFIHDTGQIQGKWLRVSASNNVNADDFHISILPYNTNSQNLNTDYFPTTCIPVNGQKTCSNLIWLPPLTSKIGVLFSWPKKILVTPENIRYQIAETTAVTTDNENRYKTWVNLLKQKYYRTKEVDWEKAYAAGLNTLAAPNGIDPLPRALWEVVSQLPERTQTHLLLIGTRKIDEALEARVYPTCIQIDTSTWRLDLPATYTAIGNKWYPSNPQKYISRAHECLSQPNADKWIVNLTEQTAGNTLISIAALAPLLGNTPIIYRKAPTGERIETNLYNFSVSTQGKDHLQWKTAFSPYKGKIDFIVDKYCGENICGAIALATKGRGRLLGQVSSTHSISNEIIEINNEIKLQLTTHWLTDKEGKIYTHVQPDVVLDEHGIEKALLGEMQ